MKEYVFGALDLSPAELLPILEREQRRLQQDRPDWTDALREVERALEECHSALRTGESLEDLPKVADAVDVEMAAGSGETGSTSTASSMYAQFHV